MEALAKNWRSLRIAAIDTETTGLDATKHKIVEIGIVYFENMVPVEKYCRLINPMIDIDPGALAASGISQDMVENKKTFEQLGSKILSKINDCDAWCMFNDTFDRSMLYHDFKRIGVDLNFKPTFDPLIICNYLWPAGPNNLDAAVQRLRIIPSKDILDKLEISKNRHRADYDALLAGMALFRLSDALPTRLDHTLIVQNWMYHYWLNKYKNGEKKYSRQIEPYLPKSLK